MSAVISKMFLVYGLTIIVSMLVAVMIKIMTTVLAKMDTSSSKVVPPTNPVARPVVPSVDQTQGEIAAIAAAVYAMLGGSVRIIRIEPSNHGVAWTASGRMHHHMSHIIQRRSPTRTA